MSDNSQATISEGRDAAYQQCPDSNIDPILLSAATYTPILQDRTESTLPYRIPSAYPCAPTTASPHQCQSCEYTSELPTLPQGCSTLWNDPDSGRRASTGPNHAQHSDPTIPDTPQFRFVTQNLSKSKKRGETGTILCERCGYKFTKQSSLNRHQKRPCRRLKRLLNARSLQANTIKDRGSPHAQHSGPFIPNTTSINSVTQNPSKSRTGGETGNTRSKRGKAGTITCERCGHKFAEQSSLTRHQKMPCRRFKANAVESCGSHLPPVGAGPTHLNGHADGSGHYRSHNISSNGEEPGFNSDQNDAALEVHVSIPPTEVDNSQHNENTSSMTRQHLGFDPHKNTLYSCRGRRIRFRG